MSSHEAFSPNEQPTSAEDKDRITQNALELMHMPSVGRHFVIAYYDSLHLKPELSAVQIRSLIFPVKLRNSVGVAVHPGSKFARNGQPTVFVNSLFDLDSYETTLARPSAAISIIGRYLGMEPQQMSPKTLATFFFLHELGHAHSYGQYPNIEEYETLKKEQLGSLPVPYTPPDIMSNEYMRTLREKRPEFFGGRSSDQLRTDQQIAWRDLPLERYADRFAADIMRQNPGLIFR